MSEQRKTTNWDNFQAVWTKRMFVLSLVRKFNHRKRCFVADVECRNEPLDSGIPLYRMCFSCFFFVLCFLLVSSQRDILALEYNEFSTKPPSEQRELIVEKFSSWLDATRNLRYTSNETLSAYNQTDKSLNLIITLKTIHRHWIDDDVYRMMTTTINPNDGQKIDKEYQYAYDKRKGVCRGFVEAEYEDNVTRQYGRIDTVQPVSVMYNPLWSWLCNNFITKETAVYLSEEGFLFPFSLERKDEWKITLRPNEQCVMLTVPFDLELPYRKNTRQVGHKTFILDPKKNFLPIKIDSHWEELPKSSSSMYQTERFTVEESVEVDRLWVPTTLKYELLEFHSIPNQVHVRTMHITDIEFGTVKKSDVEIVFPEGTEVVDAINGISYKTDARGNPVEETIEPLYGLDPSQVNLPAQQPKKHHIIFRLVLTTTGLLLILYALWSMYRKRKDG